MNDQEDKSQRADTHASLGDITIIWDMCGYFGLCPDCHKKESATGCGARYQVGQVRGEAEWPYVDEQVYEGVIDAVRGTRCGPIGSAATPQPHPTGEGQVVIEHVIQGLEARAEFGLKKYGTLLRTSNGRDALVDAYQEALDLVMYLAQAIMEREEALEQESIRERALEL